MLLQECVPILQQTPNLVYCELALFSDDDDGEPESVPDITLSSLRSLTLDGGGLVSHPLSRFLKSLFVPALHDLRIEESFLGRGSYTIDTLVSFISESRCHLQELCITDRVTFAAVLSKALKTLTHSDWRIKGQL
jgi:hypothetical protein